MRCFNPAWTAILAHVAELRQIIVPILGLWTWDGFLGVRTKFMDYGLEYRSLRWCREFGDGYFHKFLLPLVNWGVGVVWRKAKSVTWMRGENSSGRPLQASRTWCSFPDSTRAWSSSQ